MRVAVSDGVWPDVMSEVRVHVRDLEDKAIRSSASLRLTGALLREHRTFPTDYLLLLLLLMPFVCFIIHYLCEQGFCMLWMLLLIQSTTSSVSDACISPVKTVRG